MEERIDEGTEKWINSGMNDEGMNEGMDEWRNGRRDEWMGRCRSGSSEGRDEGIREGMDE